METTILLAKVLGLFLIVAGAAILLRRRYYVPVVGAFVEERLTRMIIGILELLAGLFLVITHTDWSSLPASIITAVGWLLVIESVGYLLLSDQMVDRIIRMCNRRAWYLVGGALSMVLGVYLVVFGFGLM